MDNKKLILETLGLFFGFCIMVLIVGSLIGCSDRHIEAQTETGTSLGHNRFQLIEGDVEEPYGEAIYVDTETGVQYLYIIGYYRAGLTVLVDHDGKPLIAEGYKDY